MADYGIAIKKALYNGAAVAKNVTDCSDFELAYSSKFLVPKQSQFAGGQINVTSTDPAAPAIVTITHSLGYVPVFYVNMELTSGSGAYSPLGNDTFNGYFDCYATTTQLIIEQHTFSVGVLGIYNYSYYIFLDDSGTAYG